MINGKDPGAAATTEAMACNWAGFVEISLLTILGGGRGIGTIGR